MPPGRYSPAPGRCSSSRTGRSIQANLSLLLLSFISLPLSASTSQTITFGPVGNTALSTGAITLTATASSGLAVTFASTTQSVCTVGGNSVTLVALGTCSITASQAGN